MAQEIATQAQRQSISRRALTSLLACQAVVVGLLLWLAVDRLLGDCPRTAGLAAAAAALALFGSTLVRRRLRNDIELPLLRISEAVGQCAFDRRAARCGPQASGEAHQLAVAVDALLEHITRVETSSRAIIAAARDAIVTINHRGVVQTFNPAAEQMFGHPSASMIGRNIARLMPEDNARQHDAYLARYLETGVAKVLAFPREELGLRADGSTFPISLFVTRIDDGSGQPLFCGIVRDITERQQTERDVLLHAMQIEQTNVQLAQAKLEAEAARILAEDANRSKSEFLANMSHEIRTPMTAILGFTESLLADDVSEAEGRQSLETIQRNGEHLMALIDDILDLSKIEAGRLTMERVDFSVVELVAEVASLMRVRADSKKVQLCVDYAGPLPATIRSDPTRLRQVLINLCGNAIKFTERGAVTIRVSLTNGDRDAALAFAIIDTGIGLLPDQVPRLFRPFEQADSSTTRRFGGTGLGLSISKHLVEMLGGAIVVSSEPGQGSTFSFSIDPGPLQGIPMLTDIQEALLSRNRDRAARRHETPTRLHGRILVAEDGPDNQHLIRFLLEKAGAEVAVVGDGAAAVASALAAAADGAPFDLVLMDMQMPVMNGYQASAELRQRGFTRPIVALTANAMAGDRERCLAAGCTEFASKPVNRKVLLAALARLLAPPAEQA